MPIVSLDLLRQEMVNRSNNKLERLLDHYEEVMQIKNSLTIEQNTLSVNARLCSYSRSELEDWYLVVLSIDSEVHFCSLTDKQYRNKVIDFSLYKWLGLDYNSIENMLYLLSTYETINTVNNDSIIHLSKQLQSHIESSSEILYRVVRILVVAYNHELYNTILTLTGFLLTQLHLNILN